MATTERDRYGFRLRGERSTRLEAFVDAAFAFAVTLLAIGGNDVPQSLGDLRRLLLDIPAFAGSFVLIAQIWWSHYKHSQRYGLEDGVTVFYSLLLVFLVLVFVYPLKLLFIAFFAWISDGWLQSGSVEMGSTLDLRTMFAVYGIAYAVLSALFCGMFLHVLKLRTQLGLDPRELLHTRYDLRHWCLNLGFGVISSLLALGLPERLPYGWMHGLPGLIYFALGPAHGLLVWRRQCALRLLPPAPVN